MNQEQLKGMLGSQYQYRRILTSGEVHRLQKENPSWFTSQAAASLVAGCVRLDAVLFRDGNALRLGYDLFVKDQPDTPEWVCYDNPETPAGLEEDAMCAALDQLVREHGLSYTECCFSSLDGKTVKKCPHDMGLGLR